MLNMAKHQILPAIIKYSELLGNSVGSVKNAGVAADIQVGILEKICSFMKALQDGVDSLEKAVSVTGGIEDVTSQQEVTGTIVIPVKQLLRQAADELETIVDLNIWLLATYTEMLFQR